MAKNIKITIITICYNAETTIKKTIDSVLSQNYQNIEYIIIDGQSTDKTLEIINTYNDSRIKVISEKDDGISDAFNKGIKNATGELIGLINADDQLLPNTISKVVENYDGHSDVVFGDTLINDFKNNLAMHKQAMPIGKLVYEMPFIHQSSFVRKDTYEKHGLYSEEYKICMDYDFFARLYRNNAMFQYLPIEIACFNYGGTSCKHPFKTINENTQISRKHGISFKKAFFYKSKLYLRNLIKIILSKLHLWNFLYRFKSGIYRWIHRRR